MSEDTTKKQVNPFEGYWSQDEIKFLVLLLDSHIKNAAPGQSLMASRQAEHFGLRLGVYKEHKETPKEDLDGDTDGRD